jgi:hypothetical protein
LVFIASGFDFVAFGFVFVAHGFGFVAVGLDFVAAWRLDRAGVNIQVPSTWMAPQDTGG